MHGCHRETPTAGSLEASVFLPGLYIPSFFLILPAVSVEIVKIFLIDGALREGAYVAETAVVELGMGLAFVLTCVLRQFSVATAAEDCHCRPCPDSAVSHLRGPLDVTTASSPPPPSSPVTTLTTSGVTLTPGLPSSPAAPSAALPSARPSQAAEAAALSASASAVAAAPPPRPSAGMAARSSQSGRLGAAAVTGP